MNEQGKQEQKIITKYLRVRDSSLKDILHFVFFRKKIIIITGLAVFTIAAFVTITAPNVYRSEARLLIQLGRENLTIDPSIETSGPRLSIFQQKEKLIKTETAILNSEVVAENVVRKIGSQFVLRCGYEKKSSVTAASNDNSLQRDIGEDEAIYGQAVSQLMGGFSSTLKQESSLIDLYFTSHDPYCAQIFLDEYIEAYNDRHIELNKMLADISFFEEQVNSAEKNLFSVDDEILKYKRNNNITSIREQEVILVGQVDILQQKLDTISSEILATVSKITSFENNLKERSKTTELAKTTGNANFLLNTLKPRLLELKLKEVDLMSRFTDDYRPLIELRDQIKITENSFQHEPETLTHVTRGLDEVYATVEIQKFIEESKFKALLSEQSVVAELLEKRKKNLKKISESKTDLEVMQRQKDIFEKEYLAFNNNLQRAKIAISLDMEKVSNIRIIQPARLMLGPIKPDRRANILLGLIIGFLAGFGMAFVVEYFDDTMKTVEDVEKKLGVSVLTYVSQEEFESCT